MTDMRILTLDIETSPMDCYAWSAWQQNIYSDQIKAPTVMLTWAAKWSNERKPIYRMYEDADHLTKLHELLDEADMTVGYNHEKFDHRHINREFLLNGLTPTRPVPMVDLLKTVKKRFHFPHYKLDYVASEVLGEKKLDTGGFDLWPEFMGGNAKAHATMKRYNVRDTVLTEKLYKHILPWIPNHPYVGDVDAQFTDDFTTYTCECCGSHKISLERPRRTRCFAIRVVKCGSCGHYQDGMRKKLQ
jgi:DNA polymerase elongation subunit (family B)